MSILRAGVSRRNFLGANLAMGAAGLANTHHLNRSATAAPAKRPPAPARAVIVLLQEGGMSQLESWDPKPSAPAEIRGSFSTIATTLPEFRIGEHMPRLSRQTSLFNVVRSVYMDNARRDHSPGLHWVLTGYDNQAAGVSLQKVNHLPSVGAVVAHQLGTTTPAGVPNFVAIPNAKQLGNRVRYTGPVHLGAACDAFDSGVVPETATGRYRTPKGLTLPDDVSAARLRGRRQLLAAFAGRQSSTSRLAAAENFDAFRQQSFELLLGQQGQQAFDLNSESRSVREMYGAHAMGQGTLLARRLVEAGVTYVLVNFSRNNSWDTHNNNFKTLRNTLLPPMDQAASALLVDLEQRGMLDEVLVLMMGEMGRTPRINKNSGRDHWPDVFSLLVAGGGLTRGQVLGSSSRHSETPLERPVHYHEILATLYHQLGIDHHQAVYDDLNRPVRIMPESEPVDELLA